MRKLTDHIVEGDSANHQLTIEVHDEPGQGGANHSYAIYGLHTQSNSSAGPSPFGKDETCCPILFQNGPIKEHGVNGVTQEALLAIVIDRLRSFQKGPFASPLNYSALRNCEEALINLQQRTRERIKRGVEGTNQR
jgi:hypothetical protein